MDDKITVIVPVYNVENYLRKCLDSIITQTYKNIEIVVVNDGSTDASGEICKEFSEMDHRILYIEQENAGLSAARNTGLNNMSGNYVTFVDSDDWIEQDYVETLYKKIVEYQADIAVGNYYSFNESEGMFYFNILGDSYYEKVYDNVSIFENLYETQEMKSFALISAWGKLYKARLFEQLRFDIGKLGEASSNARNLSIEGWKKDEELLLELSKGGFGLVWGTHQNDGESNQYYTLNISHKVSTYLTAGIPVIVPSNLSTAKFIVDQGLGFMADSLEEVHAIVDKMNLQEYQEMTNRIKTFSYLLKEGYFTKKLLVDAIYHLGID